MKVCSQCKKRKRLDDFYARGDRRPGRVGRCKSCISVLRQQAANTPKGRAARAWNNMQRRALNASGCHPTYANVSLLVTREEFYSWSVPEFKIWMKKHPDEIGTIDRILDGNYVLGNLQILTQGENTRKRSNNKNIHAPRDSAWCGLCRRYRKKSNFHRDRSKPNGLNSTCKRCARELFLERRKRTKSNA